MLTTSSHGPITRIWMARGFFGRTLHSVSAYLVGDTLVDSGCPATAGELAAWCDTREIRRVVHTHHHEDHIGGDVVLVRRFGVDVLAPAVAVAIMERFYRLPWYRRLVWGQPGNVIARPFASEVEIGPDRYRVIPTPGHAQDHVCLFEPERRWLFSGDLFIHPKVTHLRRCENASTILDSLRRIRDLSPALMVCSHAGFVANPCAALDQRIEFWEKLADRARRLTARGVRIGTVRRRLIGAEGAMRLLSGGDFSKGNLIESLLRSDREARCIRSR
jgi:glyoxylase-like metal-dependent hydrolase (beta-lactamase superfamily II)